MDDIVKILLRSILLMMSIAFCVCSLYHAVSGNTVEWAAYGEFSWCLLQQIRDKE